MVGLGGMASYAGFKTYRLFESPDLLSLDKHKLLLGELADTIIPPTNDSPGAKEVEIGVFIAKMVKDCTELKSQNNFINGLKDIIVYSENRYNKSFQHCSLIERSEILHHFEKRDRSYSGILGKVERRVLGNSFFQTLKEYTVLGYCTSRMGATKALAYDYIPGKYINTVLAPGQKAWATQ